MTSRKAGSWTRREFLHTFQAAIAPALVPGGLRAALAATESALGVPSTSKPIPPAPGVGGPIWFDLKRIPFVLENSPTPAKNAPETMAGGVAIFDYNGDGRPDIFFANGANIATLRKEQAPATTSALLSGIMTTMATLTYLSPGYTTAPYTTITATERSPTLP